VLVSRPRAQRHEVVAGVLARGGSVLLCHRGPGAWYADTWDLPGGHIDVGESASAALRRELREELGIEVADVTPQPAVRVTADGFDMRVWLVTEWSGEPGNMASDEHDAIAWFATTAIGRLRLADKRYVSLIDEVLAGAGRLKLADQDQL
jgi:8-oxo-dGTP diphosphatase